VRAGGAGGGGLPLAPVQDGSFRFFWNYTKLRGAGSFCLAVQAYPWLAARSRRHGGSDGSSKSTRHQRRDHQRFTDGRPVGQIFPRRSNPHCSGNWTDTCRNNTRPCLRVQGKTTIRF